MINIFSNFSGPHIFSNGAMSRYIGGLFAHEKVLQLIHVAVYMYAYMYMYVMYN